MADDRGDLNAGIYPRGFSSATDWPWPLVRSDRVLTLNYGKALTAATRKEGAIPVYGTNGQCGWHNASLSDGPGLILGRKGQGPLGVEWCKSPFWVIDTAYYVSLKEGSTELKYLYYLIKYIGLNHLKDGTSNPSLSRDTFGALLLPIPPRPEQQALACILGALDDKIELNRQRNRTLEAMARAMFQSWFVDFDPVKAKAAGRTPRGLSSALAALFPDSFTDSSLGPIPKGWRVCQWGDIATLEYGKSLRDYVEGDGQFRVFGTNGPIGWHTESLCDGPGIVIGRKGAYRGVHYSPRPFFVIDTGFYLNPKQPIDMKWAYYELVRCDINSMDSGSAIPSTSRADFYAIPVCLPTSDVLDVFGRLTQPIFDQKDKAENVNVTLAALRNALLPKLISGELRVPDAERIVGRAM